MNRIGRNKWFYYLSLLSLTFFSWGIIAVGNLNYYDFPAILLFLCGGLSPALCGIGFLHSRFHTAGERKEFYRKMVDLKNMGINWLFLLFLYPLISLAALFLGALFSGRPLSLSTESSILNEPSSYFLSFLPVLLGVVGEETGWRGYAQRFMGKRENFLKTALVIGAVWSIWHTPLFFIKDTYQNEIGFLSMGFAVYMFELLPISVIMGYLFYKTEKSTAAMIIFHFVMNINPVENLFFLDPKAKLIRLALFIVVAVYVSLRNRRESALPRAENRGGEYQ